MEVQLNRLLADLLLVHRLVRLFVLEMGIAIKTVDASIVNIKAIVIKNRFDYFSKFIAP